MKTYQDVLQQLTIDEKLKLTHGNSNWTFFGLERLGYPELLCGDGPHGLRAYKDVPNTRLFDPNTYAPTTLFPIATAMAATFNPSLIEQVGQAIGEECNEHYVDLLLAPGVNLKRSPLGGRNFEYYSEDPYMSGVCATAFINGVQRTGVGACIKHYALNEQENSRRFIDTIVDDMTLHDHYLRPFYDAIRDAKPLAVMTSYNRVHGDYAGESAYLIKDILRNQWGYDGLVLSDWGGVQHKVKSVKNGMNLEMPGPSEFHVELEEAIASGELTEAEVDESLVPLFRFHDRVRPNPNHGKPADMTAHHKVAQELAKEAIVLLENDGILPLKPGVKLAVIGQFADQPRINGGGSASLKPYQVEHPLTELKQVFDVTYAQGYDEETTNQALLAEVDTIIPSAEVILYFTGTTAKLESEGYDREHMELPEGHQTVLEHLIQHNKPIVVVLSNGSALDVTPLVGRVNAIVESWLLGGANASVLVQVLDGRVNPSGRLTETFPLNIEQTPHFGEFPCRQDVVSYHGDLLKNGYRYYDLHRLPPSYPFGYGLSYTTFRYDSIQLDKSTMMEDETLRVQVTITNTGDRYGKETVQLYVRDVDSFYPRPNKELKAFRKVALKPGETTTVLFELDETAFQLYWPDMHQYMVEPGQFDILVGPNVNEVPLSATVNIKTHLPMDRTLTMEHPMKTFKQYKPDAFATLSDEVGKIMWWNMEEPARRVLNRYKRRNEWSDETYQNWVETLLK